MLLLQIEKQDAKQMDLLLAEPISGIGVSLPSCSSKQR